MKTSTKRILSIGLALLFFVGAVVVYGGLIRPEVRELIVRRGQFISKDNLYQNQQKAVTDVQKLISQFQSIAALQKTVSLAMPVGESTTQAIGQLQAIVNTAPVSIRTFTLKPDAFIGSKEPLAKRLGVLQINLGVIGTYDGIKNFVRFMETNIRVTNIKEMRVAPSNPGAFQDLFTLVLTMETYYQEKTQ